MAKVKMSIGSARKVFVWDRASFPFMSVRKASDDTPWFRTGAFLKVNADGDFDAGTVDGDEDDVDDLTNGFRFANNAPIKWKTTGGNSRVMLKLDDTDKFLIGNNDADGANKIIFRTEGIAGDSALLDSNEFRLGYSGVERNFVLEKPNLIKGGLALYTSDGATARTRMFFGLSADNETGVSNAGSEVELRVYDDAGTSLIDRAFSMARTAGASMFFTRPFVGPSTWTIGPSSNVDLLTLASGSLTIDGDLIGDASFQIGPSGDTDLLVLTSGTQTVNGRITVTGNIAAGGAAADSDWVFRGVGSLLVYKGTAVDYTFTTTDVGAFNSAANSRLLVGQSTSHFTALQWIYNATTSSAYFEIVNNGNQMIYLGKDTSGHVTCRGDLAVNGGDFTSVAATFNFLTANVTTFTALQAMTSGSIGATTGATRFRHDLHVGDGSGAQFLRLDGGAANRDLEFHNNASTRWRHRVDSSEDYRLYRSADGSSFSQVWYIDNSDGNGYLGTDPRWAWDANGRLKNKTLDHDVTCYVFDDFLYSDVDLGAYGHIAGWEIRESSGTVSIVDGGGNGIVRLESGSPGGAYACLIRGSRTNNIEIIRYNAYPVIFECRAKNNTTSTNGALYVGLRGVGTGIYAYFYKDSSNSGNWICKSKTLLMAENSTNTSVSSTSFHLMRIEIESSSSLKFYIDDVLVATHTTNLPGGNLMIEFEAAYLTGNSTEADLYVDYAKATWARA